MTVVSEAKQLLKPNKHSKPRVFLPTGSTLLNLACSGKVEGGWPCGEYVLFVGDTDSGKTWVCLNSFAEAASKRHFDEYRDESW